MFNPLPYSGYLLAVALGICLTAGWSVSLLFADLAPNRRTKLGWRHLALFVSAGLGVWATHFSAMLAYRPDLTISYAPVTTALSACVGVLLVGFPCAAMTALQRRCQRLPVAMLAGFGIWCMHATGVAGMSQCRHSYSLMTNVIGASTGAGMFVLWQARRWSRPRLVGTFFFAGAVCATHFISLSGDEVLAHAAPLPGRLLSPGLIAACTAFAVSIASLATLLFTSQIRSSREREARTLKAVIESMSDGLIFFDALGRIRHFNQRFLELFDTPSSRLSAGMTIDAFLDVVAHHRGWTGEKRLLVGGAMKEWVTAATTFDRECDMEDGRTYLMRGRDVPGEGIVLTFNDVTSERKAMNDLEHLVRHDALTRLWNRRALRERKSAMIELGEPFVLFLIDLDEFKQINDTFGHVAGDRLLVHCADVLTRMFGCDAFVARMGGDEIAILLSGRVYDALFMARTIIDGLAQPIMLDGVRMVPGCSIGIAQWTIGVSEDDLMRRADMALYEAKRTGRRRACAYEPRLAEDMLERQFIMEGLHGALHEGRFALAFQPVVDIATGHTTGYEALLRWHHPARGWISPDVFIPVAEECGLIDEIGRWIIADACRQLSGWSSHLHLAINVSAIQLSSDALLAQLAQAVTVNGIEPGRLEIEITETALMRDPGMIAARLDRIRAMGIRIALDDFGTGQSSLAHLRNFHFDRIKIDRSFVIHAATDARSMTILRATVAIGRELGVITHAEGVETREQLELLRSIGCDVIQGYFVGRPIIPDVRLPDRYVPRHPVAERQHASAQAAA